MPVSVVLLVTAAVALAAAVVVCVLVRRERCLRRRLARERAAHRLTEGCLHRDLDAFRARVEAVVLERAVVAEAGRLVEAELVSLSRSGSEFRIDPYDPYQEGGPV